MAKVCSAQWLVLVASQAHPLRFPLFHLIPLPCASEAEVIEFIIGMTGETFPANINAQRRFTQLNLKVDLSAETKSFPTIMSHTHAILYWGEAKLGEALNAFAMQTVISVSQWPRSRFRFCTGYLGRGVNGFGDNILHPRFQG